MTEDPLNPQAPGTPLSDLIDSRLVALGIGEKEFLQTIGFRDKTKGQRRLEAFRKADGPKGIEHLVKPMARALAIEEDPIRSAIHDTHAIVQARAKARYAETFRPHAVLKTRNSVPRPIVAAGLCGAHRWRIVKFPEGMSPPDYVHKVLEHFPEGLPFWGPVDGFWINYTPDHCVEFDREGVPRQVLSEAVRLGFIKISV